jgi:hypothetical protein
MYTTTRGPAQFSRANVKAFQRKMQVESTHMTTAIILPRFMPLLEQEDSTWITFIKM